uniref:Phenylalanine--tRNA ligase beta subunit, chloroplastic n=1 Tax=Licmophora sp. TaxID=2115823 RepID=A0A2U9NNM9_9STRA|nr:phenylalanine-tRNA ligase beta subunit [Licmophora sp.]
MMLISLPWVNEIVDITEISLEDLIERLTLGGFEVEEIIEMKQNNIKTITLDISATANRSDSLSIIGIAKEISTLFNLPYKEPEYSRSHYPWLEQLVNIPKCKNNISECSGFMAIEITNLSNKKSPEWVKTKLINSGITPQNNLLDYQSYILLETGYPFEFYDLDKIKEKTKQETLSLSMTRNHESESFLANDSVIYELNDLTVLLNVNNQPISIAGLIPHANYSYSSETTSLLIEGSIFDAGFIRKQGRVLRLRTERSSRYEKSIKNVDLIGVFYKLIHLLTLQNPDSEYSITTYSNFLKPESKIISLDYRTCIEILGPIRNKEEYYPKFINTDLICHYFERLKFKYQFDQVNKKWSVEIPELRLDDIERPIDLIEEIGRLHGFDNFLTRLPHIKQRGMEDKAYKMRKKITNYLLSSGLNELIHYSLVTDNESTPSKVQLLNPQMQDLSFLRISLLPSLIKSVKENLNRGNGILEGFEYGHTFIKLSSDNSFTEKEFISGVLGGQKTKRNWSLELSPLTWFEAKGTIEKLFEQLRLVTVWKPQIDLMYQNLLHPYRSAKIFLSTGEYLGIFGQINPILANKQNIPFEIYLFELDFNLLSNNHNAMKIITYQQFSTFPTITKDISFIIDQTINFDVICNLLLKNGTRYLIDIKLIDEYKDINLLTNNKISLCLKTVFQSPVKTLETNMVDEIMENLKSLLTFHFRAEIRT